MFQYLVNCSHFYLPILLLGKREGGGWRMVGTVPLSLPDKEEIKDNTGTISHKGRDSDKTFLPRGEAQGYHPPITST